MSQRATVAIEHVIHGTRARLSIPACMCEIAQFRRRLQSPVRAELTAYARTVDLPGPLVAEQPGLLGPVQSKVSFPAPRGPLECQIRFVMGRSIQCATYGGRLIRFQV